MKRAKFIINSAITKSDKMNHLESIIGCLILNQIVSQVDVAYTTEDGNACELASQIKPGEYDFITAVGGDGTVHDVINGVIASGSNIPVAIISTGTANSFAKFIELPSNRNEFCKMIKKMNTVDIEVGRINDRYFLNSVVGGFVTNAVTSASQESKAVFGKMAYILGAAKVISADNERSSRIRYESKEFTAELDTMVFVVKNANAKSKKRMTNLEALNSGWFEVMIIEKAGIKDIPSLLLKFMQNTTVKSKGIKTFRTKSLDISLVSGKPMTVEFDKETYGELPLHLEPVAEAVKLVVP